MNKKEVSKSLEKINFESKAVKKDLINMIPQMSDFAVDKLLKSLLHNSHKVVSIRVGESRRDNYKKMIFIDIQNLNNQRYTYRVDFIASGKIVEIMKGGAHPWKQVSTW